MGYTEGLVILHGGGGGGSEDFDCVAINFIKPLPKAL